MSEKLVTKEGLLEIYGARVHNLKNIDVLIPRDRLVVITGLSGSGKSSLAFDTVYAEGQRRYIETFASYARQFLGTLERPDVDNITGLSPVISIEQKSINRSPRSTVGTVTEIYDLLRLLFARTATAYSYNTGEPMVKYADEEIVRIIQNDLADRNITLLAPVIKGRKGHYQELFAQIRRSGFQKVRVDGSIHDLNENLKLDRYKTHDIEIVIDRLTTDKLSVKRLTGSVEIAMKHGKGSMTVLDQDTGEVRFFSRSLMCPTTGIAYEEPQPNSFSFNSPYGACHSCNGLGTVAEISVKKIVPNRKLSIGKGAIVPIGKFKNNWIFRQLEAIGIKYDFDLDTPLAEISDEALDVILYGSNEVFKVKESNSNTTGYSLSFEGIVNFIGKQHDKDASRSLKKWASSFMHRRTCPKCQGARLKQESLHFRIAEKDISQLSQMDIRQLQHWLGKLLPKLDDRKQRIADEVLKEITTRLSFLLDVGLDYLSLDRPARSLSGGESQRIRLATQIGSQLVGVLYILDEPSIGLHQRDNQQLIGALKKLRDSGNSVIVVEHDKEMMLAADHIIDMGPGAGVNGGRIVAQGTAHDILESASLTAAYLSNRKSVPIKNEYRKGNGEKLKLTGASGNNLKKVDVDFPLGKFICVTGVSGSGKSTLINQTLYPLLSSRINRSERIPLPFKELTGIEHIDKVISIDQGPIGRTPRSNPATYTGVFTEIRNLFTMVSESQIRGYKPGRFSFNVKGGRCEECQGAGVKTIEMNFLPDVHIQCPSCRGNRYNRETLEVRYKGRSISDVLNMNINEAVEFFANIPSILKKISTIRDVGLGYIKLGQSATTLSGGEAQRIKLAAELSKRDTGKTFYMLDEPTTGLHFEDIRVLLEVLDRLVDKGNTVLVIEHNLDIIRSADHMIDLGPEGGRRGGHIVAVGTPLEVAGSGTGHTATYLRKELEGLHGPI